jgi:hypothetical protein
MRSRIVLACPEGLDNTVVAERVGCEPHTVSKGGAGSLNIASAGWATSSGRAVPARSAWTRSRT